MGLSGGSSSGFHFIQDYQRCRRYWYLHYTKELMPQYRGKVQLYGEAVHAALEDYYKIVKQDHTFVTNILESITFTTTQFKFAMEEREELFREQEDFDQYYNKGIAVLTRYFTDNACDLTGARVLYVEKELQHQFRSGAVLTGKIDLIVRNGFGDIIIIDHKTSGWRKTALARTLNVSGQSSAYLFLARMNAIPARYISYNVLFNVKSAIDFFQVPVYRTSDDLEQFGEEMDLLLNEIKDRITMPLAYWQKNTASCFMYGKSCEFVDRCISANFE